MRVGRPASAAPTATRNATVTFSGSSIPVARLMTAFPAMVCSPSSSWGVESDGKEMRGWRRPGFPLQIKRFERVEEAVLHGEQRGGRSGGGTGLGVDAFDVGLCRLGRDREALSDLPRR